MMADQNEHEDPRNQAEAAPQAEPAAVDAETLAAALRERDEMKDRLLRTLAEMENLRRRTEREVADSRTYAVTNFARDIVGSADNIRRALESVPAEAREHADGALKGLIEGIELTERDLGKTLERHGVKIVDPKGQRFDPNRHQAMFEVPDTQVPNGTVVQVVQTGYVIGDRTLRPALVGVSKGGPKPEAAKDKPADAA
ncbi:nucleotide exchange factor GrpE [Methylobacterium sp. C25]|uniref:nucleotide exchange factor GrpE n=1 Tax=Methylobacterium sp. C25 TaxID=2721622 RepID=UPI001F32B895|nr:nucleotide exchange factor GrpE [Methylobacterium sp. C25]MCE4224473.1 nucleotide exchange factor GrpE [Methylobacterium sp. C25]